MARASALSPVFELPMIPDEPTSIVLPEAYTYLGVWTIELVYNVPFITWISLANLVPVLATVTV